MKIIITGAGGGHFYPLLAVIENIKKETYIQKISTPEVFFLSDKPYDEKALFDLQIKYEYVPAGKIRVYFSLLTITDIFKTLRGIFVSLYKVYKIYPDVVFAKGGYSSFPVLLAAKILAIPVVVHESDTVAGRTTTWAGKFAQNIALSYPEAIKYFNKDKVAVTGQPIRSNILPPESFEKTYPMSERPNILVLGGSQGSQMINEAVINILPELLKKYNVFHQAGVNNLAEVKKITSSILKNNPESENYFCEGFINVEEYYPITDLVITRAGSALFEMALWRIPMIIIPINESISRDQKSNAYAFNSRGVAHVLEENNLSSSVLLNEIESVLDNKDEYMNMTSKMKELDNSREASGIIGREIIRIALSHQK